MIDGDSGQKDRETFGLTLVIIIIIIIII